jgi:hypothetical protein
MGDLASTLVVFGVIGYLILRHCCHRTSLRWDALEWQQNVFESTAFGLLLFGIGRLTAPWIQTVTEWAWRPSTGVFAYMKHQLPFPFTGTVVASVGVGLVMAQLSNWRWSRDRSLQLAVRHHGGSLSILLHDAHRSNRPVMLTLENRKVYVGWVFTPPPLKQPSQVVMFPTLSGYRDAATLSISWTTNYSRAYEDIIARKGRSEETGTELEHFQLVIPLEAVESATYFDIDIYNRHFAAGAADPSAGPATGDDPTAEVGGAPDGGGTRPEGKGTE